METLATLQILAHVTSSQASTNQTEASLRAQLEQTDLYDLSGEKAAAEALRREDAFKEQQIQEKAQQTKELFAEQDRKQQETFQEMQRQADAQLAEKSQKEFWEARQSQEMQAGMDSELRSLHEAARQEHQQWRAEFTQGICRDDAAALINNQIEDRVGAYQERLTDMGSNAIGAAATVDKYKVKLESEASAEIESRAAELHQEHFPEYQGIAPAKPDGLAPGEIPSSGFGPFEAGPQGGYGLEELVNKKEDFDPWEATAGPTPDKPFMRNIDAPPADGKDIPDGWMKPIDPPLRERVTGAMDSAASAAAEAMVTAAGAVVAAGAQAKEQISPELIHLGLEKLDHVHEWGVVPGVPHDVAGQLGQQLELMKEHGVEGLKASAQITMEQAKELMQDIKAGAQELGQDIKAGAQELGQNLKAGAQEFEDNLKFSSKEEIERKVQDDLKKPETEQNKVLSEIHKHDVAAEADANARLPEQYKQRQADLGKSAAEIESSAAHFADHAKKVDQQMQPAQQAPAIAPEVQAPSVAPAAPAAPAAPLPPSTPAVSPITPSIQPQF